MCLEFIFFFFKQKTAYEIKECDWSSDVCSSDLFISPSPLWLGISRLTRPHRKLVHMPRINGPIDWHAYPLLG